MSPRHPLLALIPASAALAVQPGHVQDFPGVNQFYGWGGGSQFYENPGTGGVGGAGDGFMLIRNTFPGRLGIHAVALEYFGDWITAGATGVSFYLLDVADPNPLEIHFGIGNMNNFWQFNQGFFPTSSWTQYAVSLINPDPSQWTRTHGTGTLENALRNADRINFRHDVAPYIPNPNGIIGDFAIDRVVVLPAPGPIALSLAAALIAARRPRHRA